MTLTNDRGFSLSLGVWLATDTYAYSAVPRTISATTLLQPIRAIVLALQNQGLIQKGDIAALIPSRMGTAFHDSIERSWTGPTLIDTLKKLGYPDSVINRLKVNPEPHELVKGVIPVYLEQRAQKVINGFTITGQFDFVGDGILEDFKSTSVYNYIFGSNEEKYLMQGSIYKWLNPQIITGFHMLVQYIFTDWSMKDSRQNRGYPKSKIVTKKLILKSVQETEMFIQSTTSSILNLENKPQHELPLCTPEELWQKKDTWKFYKDPTKLGKSTRNFDNQSDAHIRFIKDGSKGLIKHFPGKVMRCKYCNVREICAQAQGLRQSGLLDP